MDENQVVWNEKIADNLISDASKDAANAADAFGKTDAITNLKAINYAIGHTLVEIDRKIGQTIIDANNAGGRYVIDSIKGIFSDELKATVEIKVDYCFYKCKIIYIVFNRRDK